MLDLDITADELVSALLNLATTEPVCILDSCGVGHLGSHLLITGFAPIETIELANKTTDETLNLLDEKLSGDLASIFTISYDFGLKMLGLASRRKSFETTPEPDVFIARFDVLTVHDYDTGKSMLVGNTDKFDSIRGKIEDNISNLISQISNEPPFVTSNFTKTQYLNAIEKIKELIRRGDTYQTNLTQQLTTRLPKNLTPEIIFERLRRDNPTPFSAFIKRLDSTVVSSSPERFFKIDECRSPHVSKGVSLNAAAKQTPMQRSARERGHVDLVDSHALAYARASASVIRTITTSPIKGTRRRGQSTAEDEALKSELLESQKDRAENTMIVDLLRNDLGRVCEYGTVRVEKLCDLEVHPTLFHLVSTVSGDLRPEASISDILRAVFPCGSITGAPKISTMRIIDDIEPSNRGLSMGAIGYYVPGPGFHLSSPVLDLSVAIRTMVIRDNVATFNVGGGIVIDSDQEWEYDETLIKALALLAAVGSDSEQIGRFGV